MSEPLVLYRKRYIPEEIIPLKNDIILSADSHCIITKWNTLKPRHDIARGVSAYFSEDGYKVSKIYDHNNHLVHWYCDIIHAVPHPDQPGIIFEDLLLDVIVKENGYVKVLDADELADAMKNGLITIELAEKALYQLNSLLQIIYSGKFDRLQKIIEDIE